MATILLCSESFIKENTNISDNISGKYILSAIRESQEVRLKSILGEDLLAALKAKVADGTIATSTAYKALVDKCQYFLAYTSIVELLYKTSYKVGNFGVAKSSDENLQVATGAEIEKMEYYYQSKADYYCIELQNFLRENKSDYPELSERCINKIDSNLHSAASCGIFLGGARGKGTSPRKRRCER